MVKNLPANAGDTGEAVSIPGSGRSSREGNRNLLQYSCLSNPMDRERSLEGYCPWSQKRRTQLSMYTLHYIKMVLIIAVLPAE